MPGKERCQQLKFYRNRIAIVNELDFKAKECDFQGECPGFCPACDEEILLLEKELKKKEQKGEKIKLYGLIKVAFKNGDKVYDYKPEYLNKENTASPSANGNGDNKVNNINKNGDNSDSKKKKENTGPFFLGWIDDPKGDW